MTSSNILLPLTPIEIQSLEIVRNSFNLRKDLHTFLRYVGEYDIKRSVRENTIPKGDAKRIARLLSDPKAKEEIDEDGSSSWLDFIDSLALTLKLIDYDTKGEYLGYSSSAPSYVDNYMQLNKETYAEFKKQSLQHQEKRVFQALVSDFKDSKNEFYTRSFFNRLDTFNSFGCATGVMPNLNFAETRHFLFDCLKNCDPGVWYKTSSLIQYLKKAHPFFLIPKNPKYKHYEKGGRYGNFRESESQLASDRIVNEKDPDAFERVEGRYVERFLEHIPLLLGYVELAYGDPINPGVYPSMGKVKGFKVTDLFLRFMRQEIPEPKITVHPNHEIHVEADFYPSAIIDQFSPFTDLITVDKISIFVLKKTKIIEYLAADESRDLKKLLETISHHPLPPNIVTELEEWSGHSDTFILYKNFGLLEGRNIPKMVEAHVEAVIGKDFRMIRGPETLFATLEAAEQAPVFITHGPEKLIPPPKNVTSLLIKKIAPPKKSVKPEINIKRKCYVTLSFPTKEAIDALTRLLVLERCPVEVDPKKQTLTYNAAHQKIVDSALETLKKTYRIKIEDLSV